MANVTKQEVVNMFTASEGNKGVRIIPFAAETDRIAATRGLEENVEVMTDRELMASAWEEAKKFIARSFKSAAAHKAEMQALMEEREAIINEGEERISRTEVREEKLEILRQIRSDVAEFDALHKGVMRDIKADVGEPLNPNWITWTQGDQNEDDSEEGFILPEDNRALEIVPEREDNFTPKLDRKNFEHLDWLKSKRDAKFEQIKQGIVEAARVCWKVKNINELEKWERQVHRVRDVSFEQKLLNMIVAPENRNRNYFLKQAPKYIKELYESSRMLNFEQHQQLIDMINVYKQAVTKRTKPNLKLLEMLWDLRQKAAKIMKDKEIPQTDKQVRVADLNKKILILKDSIVKSDDEIQKAMKDANDAPMISLNVARIERQRLIMIRDQMREKWAYYRDMIVELRVNKPINIDIFEQENLLNWANQKLQIVEAEAMAFSAKHGIKSTDTIENV